MNMYLTDEMNIEINDDAAVQYHCLHIAAMIRREEDPYEIISYCLTERVMPWNKQENTFDQNFTFAALDGQGVTSKHLYQWSAPVDLIEQYQSYLNQRSSGSDVSSLSSTLFYNCTPPRFGPICQYSLDAHDWHHSSLSEMVHDYYQQEYQPENVTCYIHLVCNRGSTPTCLDWSEICDGRVDCQDGIDEISCLPFVMNECASDELQCNNGQCFSNIFLRDDPQTFECLDQSDERSKGLVGIDDASVSFRHEPTFAYEDIFCPTRQFATMKYTSSCLERRADLLRITLLDDRPPLISDRCWSAMKCDFLNRQFSDPQCRTLCLGMTCRQLMLHDCPPMWSVPNGTLAFGHLFFLYMREDMNRTGAALIPPRYVCYNESLCEGLLPNRSLFHFNNSVCRRPEDFPLRFNTLGGGRQSWHTTFVTPLYLQLSQCNKIVYADEEIPCNPSTMYQCFNSSKCIPKRLICNIIPDCLYKDDEQCDLVNGTCSMAYEVSLFQCISTNTCLSLELVDDGSCNCGTIGSVLCDDEDPILHRVRKEISFPTICDGFQELFPVLIDGQVHTDESECQHWSCNNTYTRCDGFWNCLNGADEVDCNQSSPIECPSHHHVCVAPDTSQFMCLPLKRANNQIIDCLGATDEPSLCRSNSYGHIDNNLYCNNSWNEHCMRQSQLCYVKGCIDGFDQQVCHANRSIELGEGVCDEYYQSYRTDIEQFFCERLSDEKKPTLVHFTLGKVAQSVDRPVQLPVVRQYEQICHRGLLVHDRFNPNSLVCLCPPSFFGSHCQYQNQRVSLTMRVEISSGFRRTPFIIIPTLFEDSNEQIIHSYQQLTYLHLRHCQRKFNVYLLYSKRPKDSTKNYSIRIDFYEKILNPTYHGSILIPLKHVFLPVHRVAVRLQVTRSFNCTDLRCEHGQCTRYLNNRGNNPVNPFFCRCDQHWSGKFCNIPSPCTCSSDSLCVGIAANTRSICICPVNKWGPRCLLQHPLCEHDSCNYRGQCVPTDINSVSNESFVCICRRGFHGNRCQFIENQLILSFDRGIVVPELVLVHFVRVIENGSPTIGSTFKNHLIGGQPLTIFWSYPFNIAFLDFFDRQYYFITSQQSYNPSSIITRTISSIHRCPNITEVLHPSLAQLHLLRRIKFYHFICRNHSFSCFYDELHLCLCSNYGHDRLANCLEFNHTVEYDCSGTSDCLNGARCLQDRSICPQMSRCLCPTCFYGKQCQFSSSLFDFSLDAILGYYIQPHVNLTHQLPIVKVSFTLSMIICIVGLINGILSIITFQNEEPLKSGCGLYLFVSSITASLTMVIFLCKYTILLVAQILEISNRSFLFVQCYSLDFLLRVGLSVDQWLSACVSIERAMVTIQTTRFSQSKRKRIAKYVIVSVLILIIGTTIHDPIHRDLLYETDDEIDEKRIWCIASYTPSIRKYNSFVFMLHLFVPFVTNIFSAGIIIILTARQRITLRTNHTHRQLLHEQCQQFNHLLIAPIVFILVTIPRLIISLTSGCLKSSEMSWLYLFGYLLSLVPSMFTFLIFVKPSKSYTRIFTQTIARYRQLLQRSS